MARLIRASEIGEYQFCRRAWWLRAVEGLTPDNRARLQAGSALHSRHGRRVTASTVLLVVGLLLLATSVAVLLQ